MPSDGPAVQRKCRRPIGGESTLQRLTDWKGTFVSFLYPLNFPDLVRSMYAHCMIISRMIILLFIGQITAHDKDTNVIDDQSQY